MDSHAASDTESCSNIPIHTVSQRTVNTSAAQVIQRHPLSSTIHKLLEQWQADKNRTDAETFFFTEMWKEMEPDYTELVQQMKQWLPGEVKGAMPHVALSKVYGRVKSIQSIEGSIRRRARRNDKESFDSPGDILDEVHDLAGLRIVTETREGAAEVSQWICGKGVKKSASLAGYKDRDLYTWDSTRAIGPARQPGSTSWRPEHGAFESYNHRVKLTAPAMPPELYRYTDVQVEIQVTSWADNLYGDLSHCLVYKPTGKPLEREGEVALDMLRGHLKQTCLVLENSRLHFAGRVHTDVLEALAKEVGTTLSLRLEGVLSDIPYKHDLRGGGREVVSPLIEELKSMVREKIGKVDGSLRRIAHELPIAVDAAFDSPSQLQQPVCHHETRTELLQDIEEWVIDGAAGPGMRWLNGEAGAGKSTLSRTVASRLSQKGIHVASFFFKNGEEHRGNVSRLFTTIAFQLAEAIPELRDHIAAVLDKNPEIERKPFGFHFDHLVLGPLRCLIRKPSQPPIAIVIDALDECGTHTHVKNVIHLLAQIKNLHSTTCKLFLASRPEPAIYDEFRMITRLHGNFYRELALKDVPDRTLEQDISAFLQDRLQTIRIAYNSRRDDDEEELGEDWPLQSDISVLVKNSSRLFIYAATVCLEIENQAQGGHPNIPLQYILDNDQFKSLDSMYGKILMNLGSNTDRTKGNEQIRREFQATVGPTVLLSEPLAAKSLANFLGIELSRLKHTLGKLRSVIDLPTVSSSPVRIFHKSFLDYLVNRETAGDFWVDEGTTHQQIASKCLWLMRDLKWNICNLESPGTASKEVDEQTKSIHLPSEIRYACRHWAHHITQTSSRINDGDEVDYFLQHQLLNWFEVMSLLGELSNCVPILVELGDMAQAESHVQRLLYDAYRFLLYFYEGIETAPLQAYTSGLVFAPENSVVRRIYENVYPTVGQLVASRPLLVDADWGPTIMTLGCDATGVAYSPDGTRLATSGGGRITVWDAASGRVLHDFPGSWPLAVSHDGSRVVAVEWTSEVDAWRPTLFDCERGLDERAKFKFLDDKLGFPVAVAFSSDETTLQYHHRSSVSNYCAIIEWNLDSGDHVDLLKEGCGRGIIEITSSRWSDHPDSAMVPSKISLVDIESVVIQDMPLGRFTHTFYLYPSSTYYVCAAGGIVFSADRSQLAVQTGDRTASLQVALWSFREDRAAQVWTHDTSNTTVHTMAFCPTGTRIAVGCERVLLILDTSRGDTIYRLDTTSHVQSVAFSPPSSNITGAIFVCIAVESTLKILNIAHDDQTLREDGNAGDKMRHSSSAALRTIWPESSRGPSYSFWSARVMGVVSRPYDFNYSLRKRYAYATSSFAQLHVGEKIEIWDLNSGLPTRRDEFAEFAEFNVQEFSKTVISISADGSRIAVGNDMRVMILDAYTGEELWIGELGKNWPRWGISYTLALSHDGSIIAHHEKGEEIVTVGRVGRPDMRDEMLFRLHCSSGHTATGDLTIRQLVFLPDGSKLAASCSRYTIFPSKVSCTGIHIWSMAKSDETHIIPTLKIAEHLEFNPSGDCLATNIGAISLGRSGEDSDAGASWTWGYGFPPDRMNETYSKNWIALGSRTMLWLPPDYRPVLWEDSQIVDCHVLIQTVDGRVLILTFV